MQYPIDQEESVECKFGRKLGRATRQSNFYYDIVQMRQEIICTILRLS